MAELKEINESNRKNFSLNGNFGVECIWKHSSGVYFIGHIYENGEMDYFTEPCKSFNEAYSLYERLAVNI